MNKKGVEGIKLPLYLLADLLIGVMFLVILLISVQKIMFGSVEEVIAKDMSLSIMAVSASPYNMNLDYEKNTESYEITINNDEVRVKSEDGSGKYPNLPMRGVSIQEALIKKTISIPISFSDSILYFQDTEKDFTDFCADIPFTLQEYPIKVKIDIESDEQGQTKQNLDILKAGIITRYNSEGNGEINFVTYEENVNIILGTSTGETANIEYYELKEDQKTASYHRIACYIEKTLKEDFSTQFKEVNSSSFNKENNIKIDFGDPKNINQTILGQMSKEIYLALMLGITD